MRFDVEEKASLLRDSVFAASDGIVTTFAVVAGSAGASLSTDIVLILGFANLFADGFSMAAGNYLGTKSEIEYEKASGNKHDGQAEPLTQGIVTFVAFNIAGFAPLIPYVFGFSDQFLISIILVALLMFSVGSYRSRFIRKPWFRSGLEMLAISGFAAVVAYFTGELLKRVTG
jgi:VIT1/CCC1 family predicted Fe2+/Mn2+ transporter